MKLGLCGPIPYQYLCTRFYNKTHKVHRLVANAFIRNPKNKPCVNHKDCDRYNNRADNLEWCTQMENIHHSIQLGRTNSIMRQKRIKDIVSGVEYISIREAAKSIDMCEKALRYRLVTPNANKTNFRLI